MANDTKLRTLDLFSGIGGISIGLKRWCKTVCFCEIDPYACGVLIKTMAKGVIDIAPIWSDVTTFGQSEIDHIGPIECITAGFPCTDISNAGKRAGITGEQSGLFVEIFRIVCMVRPQIIFLENVPALLTRGMDAVLRKISESGYDAIWTVLSAAEVGGHFKGERVWLLATNAETDCQGRLRGLSINKTERVERWSREQFEGLLWVQTQLAVPAGRYDRLSDGIRFRTHRLKCLGNAVVPQCAEKAFEILLREII